MSGQNRSAAVMAQRQEARDALDDFPTPPWAVRALCEQLGELARMRVREPAANRGYMAAALAEYFGTVEAADVHDYGAGFPVADYLFGPPPAAVDWTITNPPYRLAEDFVARAIQSSSEGVAVLVRTAWLEGVGRWKRIFDPCPPELVLQFSERVVMHKGRVVEKGKTATAYAWVIWDNPIVSFARGIRAETRVGWIPPGTRARLERPGDYAPRGDTVARIAEAG